MGTKTLYQNKSEYLNDAFDRIVAEIHIRKERGGLKTFMICGCEPGVGSTTIAINLAIAMANAGWKTLLVDADMRKAVNDKRLNDNVEAGLADFLIGKADFNKVVNKTNYDCLSYISSGVASASVTGMFCSNNAKVFLEEVKSQYDYVIIDMPSMASSFDASVLAASIDGTVLVTKQGTGKKKYIMEAKNKLINAGGNILGIIVNKVDNNEYRKAVKNFDYFKKQKYYVRSKKSRKAE